MTLTHDDYTVAWICALPLEMAAAKTMLDEFHPALPQPETDHNAYTLGRISGHNVVMACLPSGVYGTISASTVVSHMVSTYTKIRFGLMVGIGGGVPSKSADIRLGDVVVSKPTATSAGVIQYDYGKALRDGRFQHTGSLNKPPQVLLKAMAQIESDYMTAKSSVSKILGDALWKEEIRERFSRPECDWFFQSTYDHEGKELNCSGCDQSQLVDRPLRTTDEPYIHYGLIASGDQVMKDARTRDTIARDLGILCFEMEAAGLMDELPSLVIRGICDYCDSHKHKEWQGYAALVAAAYARALLKVVPPYSDGPSSSRSKKRHWMVPFMRNPRFVGRQNEISNLEQLIIHSKGPTKTAICGLGGIGKTQIALELAYRARERISGCSVFWIPCNSYESVEQTYLRIASDLGMTHIEPAEVKEQVQTCLSQGAAGNWLLIFDNADDMEMWTKGGKTATPLKNILPKSENGHILFTSRNRKLVVKLAPANVLSIPDMDQSTAKQMLEKLLIRKELLQDDCATTALLKQLDFLPLAITQAAAYINENDIMLSDYLSLLEEKEGSTMEMLSEEFEDDGRYAEIQNPVATTWLISFRQIQQLDELAADYLSFMGCINPRDIPQSILPPAPSSKKRVEALGLLRAYSFISAQVRDGSFSVHRLVHLATRNWMMKAKTFNIWVGRAAQRLDKLFPDNDHSNREIWRVYLPHALYLMNSEEFQDKRHEHNDFLSRIGKCLQSDGRYNEAEILFIDVLKIRERTLGLGHLDTLASASNLGSVLDDEGKYEEAEAMHRRALEGREKVLGPEHPDTLASVDHLGSALIGQAKYEEAEAMYQRNLKGTEKALGPEHPDTLASVSNLGSVLARQGKYQESEAMHRQALEGYEKVLGPEHPDTLTIVNHLGSVLARQGKYQEAEVMHRQALEGREKVLGPEHPHNLTSVNQLGSVLARQGKYEEAEAMYQRNLKGTEKALGPEHPDTLASVNYLGLVLARQGKYQEAEVKHRQALEGREKVLGPEHPDTLTSVSHLGSVLDDQGKYEEAESMHRRALEGYEKILGLKHPDTLTCMNSLAVMYWNQGRWKEAEELFVQVVAASKQMLGPEHPDTLASMNNLASTYDNQGRWKEAEELFMQVMEARKRVLGREHPIL
ncbi:violaceus kinesin [Aspergillus leporis]|jgi:tetratricopeptide (TPR) repeat protein/nucleoside phosphorylase|uniref:Violaceus kinesin n=1 Tax=Aspergillus leporis TaxID=41062 RepID=A0A5N5WZ08_9EURO|nr:violaceus kinesin [Aspergillus leporis]